MECTKCPLCKGDVIVACDRAAWFEQSDEIIQWHTPAPHTGLEPVRHIDSEACLGTGCSVALARGIAVDRAEGRHLAAHP
jgi:hypothetical protein